MFSQAILSASVEILLKKIISRITHEILGACGLNEELKRLKGTLLMIQAVLNDAEIRQVKEEAIKTWLNSLKLVAYEADRVLGEFAYEMVRRKVETRNHINKKVISFFSSNPIVFDSKMAHKIEDVNTSLEIINKQAIGFGLKQGRIRDGAHNPHQMTKTLGRDVDSFLDENVVVGRDNDASKLVEMLIGTTSDQENISFIPIVGIAGIGKTALAKLVYNDERVVNRFDARIWVRVSGCFDVKRVLVEILESLKGNKCEVKSKDLIRSYLEKELRGKKYMLLLDDVLDEDTLKWEDFRSCLSGVSTTKGNKIVVTTRGVQIASMIDARQACHLGGLAEDDCWSLFKGRTFVSGGAAMNSELEAIEMNSELEAIETEIVRKCRGVPLAAKVVGSMMQYNTEKGDGLSVQNGGCWGLDGEGENGLISILKSSINHLPSLALKQCFTYCSIFPKDCEIEKEQLIQLWMAVGFLRSDEGSAKEMEDVGNEFFNSLLWSSLFQDVKKDKYRNVTNFKLHGLVHDLAREIPHFQEQALCFSREVVFAVQKEKARFLQTLFLKSKLTDSMLLHFKWLRALNYSGANIEEVSKSIGELIHLRYLDLSNTMIKVLPKSVGKLYNLQTLRVDSCKNLKVLPNELKNLINLRHLYFRGHNCNERQLPHKIRRLTNLRTLHFFNVGKDVGRRIKELGHLKHLRGEVEIHNLEQVSCKEEAQSANLFGKENIYKLEFHWSLCRSGNRDDEDVLEGLEPYPNLKSLTIRNFLGDKFPMWVMNMSVNIDGGNGSSLPLKNLVEIKLINCRRFEHIPMLGQLPLLVELELSGMDNMTIIGAEFYGCHYSCNTNRGGIETFFPALRKFRLENMPNLNEWKEAVFPRLEKLTIWNCPELTTCPSHFPFLKELEIKGVNSDLPLAKICSHLTTLTALHIQGVSELTSLPDLMLQENKSLAQLEIRNCPMLTHVVPTMRGCCGSSLRSLGIGDCESLRDLPDGIHTLQSLENFWISRCPNIKSITSMQGLTSLRNLCLFGCDGLASLPSGLMESCTSLETLHMHNCPNLISLPKLRELPCSLSSLRIVNCDKLSSLLDGLQGLTRLNTLAIGPFSEELNSFPSLDGIHHLKLTLRRVELKGWPKWDSIPEQLQHLSALTEIHLKGFGVEDLPEWFANFSSLEQLVLEDCEKLKHFPTMEAMQPITKLRELWIRRCPILDERCAKGTGPEWPKIAYIPTIRIDMLQVQSQASP